MAKGEDTDDHHFIPQFYLRPWLSRNDRKLVEYGRVPPTMEIRCRRWVTSKTGYVPNLYTLPGVTEECQRPSTIRVAYSGLMLRMESCLKRYRLIIITIDL